MLSWTNERTRPTSLQDAKNQVLRELDDRARALLDGTKPTLIVFHGPPVERTALHAHVVFATVPCADWQLRTALQTHRDSEHGADTMADRLARSNVLPHQTLYGWLAEHRPDSWDAWLNDCPDRAAFEQRLWDEYGLLYRVTDRGAVLYDPQTDTAVRPSRVAHELAAPRLEERFGAARVPIDTTRAPRRVYDRALQAAVTPEDLRAHAAARQHFHNVTLPARNEAYERARQTYLARCTEIRNDHREGTTAALEGEPGERRGARAALRAGRDVALAQARREYHATRDDILRAHPRIDPNIIRWKKALNKPDPPALLGADGMPDAPWVVVPQGDGREGFVVDSIRYATRDRAGRLVIADRQLDDALLAALPRAEAIAGDPELAAELRERLAALGRELPYVGARVDVVPDDEPVVVDDFKEHTRTRGRGHTRR